MNKKNFLGNYVIIEYEGKEYSVFVYLKKGLVFVKKGDVVCKGMLFGRCGNFGNLFEFYIYFYVMDVFDIEMLKSLWIWFYVVVELICGDMVILFFNWLKSYSVCCGFLCKVFFKYKVK